MTAPVECVNSFFGKNAFLVEQVACRFEGAGNISVEKIWAAPAAIMVKERSGASLEAGVAKWRPAA